MLERVQMEVQSGENVRSQGQRKIRMGKWDSKTVNVAKDNEYGR